MSGKATFRYSELFYSLYQLYNLHLIVVKPIVKSEGVIGLALTVRYTNGSYGFEKEQVNSDQTLFGILTSVVGSVSKF